eukprot:Skav219802  [mRNA]  locus=scaffold147:182217:184578:- [translate_table: standard]
MAGEHVQYDYEHLIFGSYRVHKDTRCAFRPSKAEPFMDIGSIWYMYHEVSREDGSYNSSSARRRGFQYIGVIDRSELLAYIEGGNEKFEKIAPPLRDLEKAVRYRGKPLPGFKPVLQLANDELKMLG